MKATICGMGWVTPLGRGLQEVLIRLRQGDLPLAESFQNPLGGETGPVYRIPATMVQDAAAFPRLRRSSVISHFALAAATDAIEQAGLTPEQLSRTVLVFTSSDGGVIYTRRFYAEIVDRGEGTGSPLLFPETVYNAPASHIAARLGLQGEAVTLVGDAAAGIQALEAGCEFLAAGEADFCLVCAAQELDWVTCDAYQRWRALEKTTDAAPFSEGAAAIVLSRGGSGCQLETIPRADLRELKLSPSLLVSSASGTNLDRVEQKTFRNLSTKIETIAPKYGLGESFACATLQQVVVGALSLQGGSGEAIALISTAGFDQQISALFLTESNR